MGIPYRISFKWFYWCGGKEKFMLNMSITHTRKTWHVDHVQLSDLSFFREKTSLLLAEYTDSLGRNNLSRERNNVYYTQHRQWVGPWASSKKLSTKMST